MLVPERELESESPETVMTFFSSGEAITREGDKEAWRVGESTSKGLLGLGVGVGSSLIC